MNWTHAIWLALLTIHVNGGGMVRADESQQILNAVQIVPQMGTAIPLDAKFLDHRGRPIVLGELLGDRPVVLCLVYFNCPMLCKLAADGLVRTVAGLSETVGEDFDVMLVSFDPRDTPERANAARRQAINNYSKTIHDSGWHFLTGSQKDIDALTKAVGFRYVWDDETQQFAHAAGLVVISSQGIVTEYLDGVQFSPHALLGALDRADRSEVASSPPTSYVRCYLYDPTTGRFGAAVQWTIRGLGALTVFALGALIFRLYGREQSQIIENRRASDARNHGEDFD